MDTDSQKHTESLPVPSNSDCPHRGRSRRNRSSLDRARPEARRGAPPVPAPSSLFLKIDRGQQRDLRPVGLLSRRPQHPPLELQVAEFGLRQVSLTEIIAKEVNLESRRLGRSSCERCGEGGKRLRLTSSLIEPSGM